MAHFSQEEKKNLTTRLNRISGQVNGLIKMIESDRECIETLNQIVSVQAALKGVWKQVVKGHLEHCVTQALLNNKNNTEIINELVDHIERLR